MSDHNDAIRISGVQAATRIGITDEERSQWQTVRLDLRLTPQRSFKDLRDDLGRTVDYAEVVRSVRSMAAEGFRNLIETLAEDVANQLLRTYPLRVVEVSLAKFILPGVESVAVEIRREGSVD